MTGAHILADDLTGALDSAAAFAGDVPVYLDSPESEGALSSPVSVVATATRDVPIESLPGLLAPSVRWLGDANVAFKKIDSLLRGNTFAECAYIARAGGFRKIAFVPAFPQQGRITVDGRQCVIPPGGSFADRQELGAAAPAAAFAVFGLEVASSADASPDRLSVWIPEVRCDDDLACVAAMQTRAEASRWLWCGSAGLAHATALSLGLAADGRQTALPDAAPGPVLLISASHHPVVQRQWDIVKAAESGAIVALHGTRSTLRSALRSMGQPLGFAMFNLSPHRVLSAQDAAVLLAKQLDQIVRESPRPTSLVVVGGDTLRALCRAAGARALMAGTSLRAGWGCARLVGGTWDGIHVHSRSGAFGDPEDLSTMVRLVVRREAIHKEQ